MRSMALEIVDGKHIRVTCSFCRKTAELCCKRLVPIAAMHQSVDVFLRSGWHQDVGIHVRHRSYDQTERSGSGKWYCPNCASKKHL